MALTKVTGHVIKSDTNIISHNINSSGIITAVTFDGNVSGVAVTFTGDSTIGSLGITTNLNVGGISTFTGNIDANGDIDVDGHTNLDNVSIAGVTTATGDVTLGNNLIVANNKRIKLNGTNTEIFDDTNLRIDTNGSIIIRKKTGYELMGRFVPDGEVDLYFNGTKRFETTNTGAVVSGILTVTGNMNVEGVLTYQDVTNIDSIGIVTARAGLNVQAGQTYMGNTTIAGVTTFVSSGAPAVKIVQSALNTNAEMDINATNGGQARLNLRTSKSGTNRAARIDFFNQHSSTTPIWTLISDYDQDATNDFRLVHYDEKAIVAKTDGAVELYHNGTNKAYTQSSGLAVNGSINLYDVYPSVTWEDTNHNSDFRITNNDGTLIVYDITRGAHVLDFKPTGDLHVRNDKGIYFGESNDLLIGHDGTSTRIEDAYGFLAIKSNALELQTYTGSEVYAKFTRNGAVELRYDNAVKLTTSATGITVTGEVAATQDYPDLRPTLDFNFAATKKLDPRIVYYRTGPASYVNEFGRVVLVGDNTPRFDYGYKYESSNGYSLARDKCQGLLLEMTRENLVKQSIYKSDGTTHTAGTVNDWSLLYTGGGTGSLTPGFDAPDGSKDAVRWANGNTGYALLRLSIDSHTANGSDNYTLSFYVKGVSGTGNLNCDVHDGQPTIDWSGHMVTNEWRRIVVTGVPSSGAKTFIDIVSNVNNNRVFDIWGVQLENGAYATSFIPTLGEKATRGNEYAVIDGEDFTDFYNPVESSVLAVGTMQRPAASQGQLNIFHIGDSNEDGHGVFREHGTKDVWYHIRNNNTTPTGGNLNPSGFGDWDADEEARIAIAFKDGDQAISVNGGNQITASVTSSYPTADITKMWIGSHGTASFFEGHIKRIAYYSKLLTDNQLNTLTA